MGGFQRPRWQLDCFRAVIDECGLQDIGFMGPSFTWCNKREGSTMFQERLDWLGLGMKSDGLRRRWMFFWSKKRFTGSNVLVRLGCDVEIKTQASKSRFLIVDFSTNEIKRVVFNMSPTNAPDLNGLSALFYQKFGPTMGEKVTMACLGVWNDGHGLEDVNGTLITLIPKGSPSRRSLVSLFVHYLCGEAFPVVLKCRRLRQLTGFQCCRSDPKITHLFFTDDNMIFTRASKKDCRAIKSMLDIYSTASRQVINFQKSAICLSKGVSRHRAISHANILGVQIKMLVWRVCHDWLPTMTVLCKRKSLMDKTCLMCNSKLETILHALKGCPSLQVVRVQCPFVKNFRATDDTKFFDFMLSYKNHLILKEMEMLFMVLSCSWYRLNGKIHQSSMRHVNDVVPWVEAYLIDSRKTSTEDVVLYKTPSRDVLLWDPPAVGMVKVNIDSTIDASRKRVGFGIIIRDSNGAVMALSSQIIFAGYSPLVAKVAILRGIQFAFDSSFWNCIFESNAEEWRARFVPKKAYQLAHSLAKLGLITNSNGFWIEEVSPNVASFVLGDCLFLYSSVS
ncbi:hypothetical protein Ddye_005877 [Dipteronia dyeriana]|uniref:Reverse transcriptase n=1 Tax=Dipteronia dyeriana TaxID=168575 RepID=A0AAD9XH41_9ROSI|nr:hypothetical protein Ddye_005877 [Dipteronia dyeriana]